MRIRLTSPILLALYFCLLLLVVVLVAHGAFSGMHADLFHTPEMIKHTSDFAALLIVLGY